MSAPNNTIVAYTEYEGKSSELNYVTIDCDSIYQLIIPTITWVEKTEEGHTFTITDKNPVEAGLYANLIYAYNDETGVLNGEQNDVTLSGSGWFTVKAVLPGMDTAYVVSRYVASARESYNEAYASVLPGDTIMQSGIQGDFESAVNASLEGEYPAGLITVGGLQYVHYAVSGQFAVLTLPFSYKVGENIITNAAGEPLEFGVDYRILTLHTRAAQNTNNNKDLSLLVNSQNLESAVRAEGVSIASGVAVLFQSLTDKVGSEIILQNSATAAVAANTNVSTVPTNGGWRIFANGRYQAETLPAAYVLDAAGEKFVYTENPVIPALGAAIIIDPASVASFGNEIILVGDPSGIENIASDAVESSVYDLQGRKAQSAKKGIFVIDGKAVLVK